jgi:ferredoxin-NADP reductase
MSEVAPPAAPRVRGSGCLRVERVFDHASDTRSIFASLAGGGRLKFTPGQFISISIPLADETRTRPYTIASSPEDDGPLELIFNRVPGGRGVQWMFERAPGDVMDFTGPFGTFTIDRPPEAETVFIAEGTAIAPIRPMLRRALGAAEHRPIHVLYAADRDEHLLYRAEFARIATDDVRFAFKTIVAAPLALYDRLYDRVERRWVSGDAERTRQFYICGVGKGVVRIRDLLRGAGYERRAVHYEQW